MLSNDSDFVVMGPLITFANFDLDGDLSAFMSAAPAGPPARLRARVWTPQLLSDLWRVPREQLADVAFLMGTDGSAALVASAGARGFRFTPAGPVGAPVDPLARLQPFLSPPEQPQAQELLEAARRFYRAAAVAPAAAPKPAAPKGGCGADLPAWVPPVRDAAVYFPPIVFEPPSVGAVPLAALLRPTRRRLYPYLTAAPAVTEVCRSATSVLERVCVPLPVPGEGPAAAGGGPWLQSVHGLPLGHRWRLLLEIVAPPSSADRAPPDGAPAATLGVALRLFGTLVPLSPAESLALLVATHPPWWGPALRDAEVAGLVGGANGACELRPTVLASQFQATARYVADVAQVPAPVPLQPGMGPQIQDCWCRLRSTADPWRPPPPYPSGGCPWTAAHHSLP